RDLPDRVLRNLGRFRLVAAGALAPRRAAAPHRQTGDAPDGLTVRQSPAAPAPASPRERRDGRAHTKRGGALPIRYRARILSPVRHGNFRENSPCAGTSRRCTISSRPTDDEIRASALQFVRKL